MQRVAPVQQYLLPFHLRACSTTVAAAPHCNVLLPACAAVCRSVILSCRQVRVTQAALNGKYGPEEPRPEGVQFEFSWNNQDGNQPMHLDYGTHS
jgi:hypothetical protein